jgi:hypothetical protein
MITAEMLTTLTSFTAPALTQAIRNSGYQKDEFTKAKFVGITNGGQFAYKVTFKDDDGAETPTKVFVAYNPQHGSIIVDY